MTPTTDTTIKTTTNPILREGIDGASSEKDNSKVEAAYPFLFHLIFFVPLVVSWYMVSDNLSHELTLVAAMFACLFLMKFVDAMVDDGLLLFAPGGNHATAYLMMGIAAGLIWCNDFSATFFAGLTLDSFAGGKLDCIEFRLAGALCLGLYGIRYADGTLTYQLVDMLAVAGLGALEERLHDAYDEKGKKEENEGRGGTTSNSIRSQFVQFFADSRMLSVVTIVPLFLWRGYSHVAPLMLAQEYGYVIGSFAATQMLQRQQRQSSSVTVSTSQDYSAEQQPKDQEILTTEIPASIWFAKGFICLLYVVLASVWWVTSQNYVRETVLLLVYFAAFVLMKLVDDITDEDLFLFPFAGALLSVFMLGLFGWMCWQDDLVLLIQMTLTVGVALAGKIDCLAFILLAALTTAIFISRVITNDFEFGVTDFVVLTVILALDEIVDAMPKNNSNRFVLPPWAVVLAEERLVSFLIVPFFYWRGYHTEMIVPVGLGGCGYSAGKILSGRLQRNRGQSSTTPKEE